MCVRPGFSVLFANPLIMQNDSELELIFQPPLRFWLYEKSLIKQEFWWGEEPETAHDYTRYSLSLLTQHPHNMGSIVRCCAFQTAHATRTSWEYVMFNYTRWGKVLVSVGLLPSTFHSPIKGPRATVNITWELEIEKMCLLIGRDFRFFRSCGHSWILSEHPS